MWTKDRLQDLIASRMQGQKFLMVANREPFIHQFSGDGIEVLRPASGMATALDPIMEASHGTWIGHGSGDADRETVDEFDRVQVPPDNPSYTLRRLWLTKEQEEGFYDGMSNSGLWPLCLITFTAPTFRVSDWEQYEAVNRLYADAVLQEAGDDPAFVFIQDYHFGLLPRMLKERNPKLVVAQFWHIPWPNREVFRVFPWKEQLIDGLLGNDLLGFHIRYHCQNFLDTVDRMIEAKVDMEHFEITRGGRTTKIRPFPISIDFEDVEQHATSQAVEVAMEKWKKKIGRYGEHVGVGIERLDYSKGIPQRLRAIDHLLEQHPEYRRRFVFVQVCVPSRLRIPAYQALNQEVDTLVEELNFKWKDRGWKPILYIPEYQGPTDMAALHRLSRFCVINSLHDGMNLVAKEFVANRTDGDGVLILSRFTGAARELTEALLVNPFALHETADAMAQAIEMPEDERRRRMSHLRGHVREYNVYRWCGKFLGELLKLNTGEGE
jgi:alpha,alpha-trehalose-phosphate synthase [UDP-forming]